MIRQHDHNIRAVLGRRQVGQIASLEPRALMARHRHTEGVRQQLGGQLGPVTEQLDQCFMQMRRHVRKVMRAH